MLHNGAPTPFAVYPQMANLEMESRLMSWVWECTAVIPVVRRTVSLKLAWAIQGNSYNEK